ncbi:MAG: HPr family phosphocarrier protein [Lachnospiraceae bacterium]|nr:HPr family phosphocarrier protein [Lachnospiraceae bacterium]
MTEKTVTIQLEKGLEARPVAVLVQKASMHESTIYLHSEGKRVNAKSIMGMMSLGLNMGEDVMIEAEGPDETAAIESLEMYLTGQQA